MRFTGASLEGLARRGRNAQHACIFPGYSSPAYPAWNRSVHSEALPLVAHSVTPPTNSPDQRPPGPPRDPTKVFRAQVQPAAPPLKISSGAPHIVQADGFFKGDSHAFNNRCGAKCHTERARRNFLRNAIGKVYADSPHLRCCAVRRPCLVSGTLSRNGQRSFRLFY